MEIKEINLEVVTMTKEEAWQLLEELNRSNESDRFPPIASKLGKLIDWRP